MAGHTGSVLGLAAFLLVNLNREGYSCMLFFVLYHLYSTRSAFDRWISISGSNLSCLLDLQLFSSHSGGFSCRWFAILARLPCCLPESYKTSVGCGSLALPDDFSASLVHYSGLAPHVVTFYLKVFLSSYEKPFSQSWNSYWVLP